MYHGGITKPPRLEARPRRRQGGLSVLDRRSMSSAQATLEAIAAAAARERVLIAARRGGEGVMTGEADKLAALAEAVAALDAAGIRYALIGGLAVGVHSGVPRATLDVDLAVASSADRLRVQAIMIGAGFAAVGSHPHSLNFRHRSNEPVQLALDEGFDAMIHRAEDVAVGNRPVRIVRKEDLIAMKRRAAADPARRRSKALRDEADVALLLGDVPDPDEGW